MGYQFQIPKKGRVLEELLLKKKRIEPRFIDISVRSNINWILYFTETPEILGKERLSKVQDILAREKQAFLDSNPNHKTIVTYGHLGYDFRPLNKKGTIIEKLCLLHKTDNDFRAFKALNEDKFIMYGKESDYKFIMYGKESDTSLGKRKR